MPASWPNRKSAAVGRNQKGHLVNRTEAVYRRVCELYGTGDADAMAELFAEDGTYDNVPMNKPLEGREAIRDWLKMVFDHCVVEIEIPHLAINGEWVLSERIDTHVFKDRHVPLPVMNTSRIVDGQITLFRDYYCAKMVSDLGLG
jgi:limonene-1,2-epoxide hydrolase